MATSERHESTLDVAADVLYIMSKYPGLMNNETLVESFEHIIRNGAGPGTVKVMIMKREIFRRMTTAGGEKEEGKDGI